MTVAQIILKKKVSSFVSDNRFIYIRHKTNKGKGSALKSGLKKAKTEVILFLDADLMNITAKKIMKIVQPVLDGEVDFSRGSFKLSRGRVTEIAVKPMMCILYPNLSFDQPISGQVCAKKSFLDKVEFEQRWGVDIALLLDAITKGERVMEVDIGRLYHKARTTSEKAEMAKQVLSTMIKKAGLIQHKHKLVIFTLEDTLIKTIDLKKIYKELKISKKVHRYISLWKKNKIDSNIILQNYAHSFEGITKDKIEEACKNIPIENYSIEVINSLKKRKYEVGIISYHPSPIVSSIAKRLGVENVSALELVFKNNVYSGKISSESRIWLDKCIHSSFQKAYENMLKKLKCRASETIVVSGNPKASSLFKKCGLGIIYNSQKKDLKILADKEITCHSEILVLIDI